MSKNNIDDLIGSLTDELEPVKPMGCPARRIVPWVVVSVVFVVGCVFSMGTRHDISTLFTNHIFLFEMVLMTLTFIGAALSSSYLCVPDMQGQKWLIPTTLTSAGIFVLWSAIRFFIEDGAMPHLEFEHCMGEGAFMAIVPVAILIFMLKQGTTTRPYLMMSMNVLAIAALGFVALRFTCPIDTVARATLSHLLPYIALGAVLGLLARRLYKW